MRTLVLAGVSAIALTFGGIGVTYAAGSNGQYGTSSDSSSSQMSSGSSQARSNVSSSEMKQVQEKLKSEGLYKGQIDGIEGPETKQALEQYQKQQNLQQTGSLDQETLDKLGVSQTEGSGSSMPPSSSQSESGSHNNR